MRENDLYMLANDQYAQARKSTKEFFHFYFGIRDIMVFFFSNDICCVE